MTTYEQGHAPEGAPVAWQKREHHYGDGPYEYMLFQQGMDGIAMGSQHTKADADRICRAFHLAKLAKEAAAMLGGAPLTPPGTTDWLRRYREATR